MRKLLILLALVILNVSAVTAALNASPSISREPSPAVISDITIGASANGVVGQVYSYNLSAGKTRLLTVGMQDSLLIEYANTIYPLENIQIARDYANYTVSGVLSNVVTTEMRKYDLNHDKYYDLSVTFTKNYASRIELKISPINESVQDFKPVNASLGIQDLQINSVNKTASVNNTETANKTASKTNTTIKQTASRTNTGNKTNATNTAVQQKEVEVTVEVSPAGFFSRLWNSTKGITGGVASYSGAVRVSSWVAALLVIVFGAVLYFVLAELFD